MASGFALFDPLAVSRPLAWLVLAAFLGTFALQRYDREYARAVAVAGWGLFGAFWLVLVPHFVLTQKSIVEGLGSIAAVPLSLYAGYLLWRGRDSLFVMTRAIGLMGLIYLPVLTYEPLSQWLIETVTAQTAALMGVLGFDPIVTDSLTYDGRPIAGKEHAYASTFVFTAAAKPVTYTIITACTGIGSMSIFAGLIGAVDAPWRRKMRALAVSLPVIYVLNLFRNVFIGITFGHQMLQIFEGTVMGLFGTDEPMMVSYYVGDRLVAQFASVIALVVITWLVVRELPEVLTVVEDALYLLTGSEYDLQNAIGVQPVRADGGD